MSASLQVFLMTMCLEALLGLLVLRRARRASLSRALGSSHRPLTCNSASLTSPSVIRAFQRGRRRRA